MSVRLLRGALAALVISLGFATPSFAGSTASTTTLLNLPAHGYYGDIVTFIAEATGGGALPGGTVAFMRGAEALGSATLTHTGANQTRIGAGSRHSCVVDVAGAAKCWGYGPYGELGLGGTNETATPTAMTGFSSGVRSISVGSYHTCLVTEAGAAHCTGLNDNGRMGDGSVGADHTTMTPVTGLSSGVRSIAAGDTHTCAVTDAGAVKCWGGNGSGQLGDGTKTARSTPVDVPGFPTTVREIAAGYGFTCALTDDAEVWCFGGGEGANPVGAARVPTKATGIPRGVVSIGVLDDDMCVVTSGGELWCWGRNASGQLGIGSTAKLWFPTKITGAPAGVVATSGGIRVNCVLTSAGEVWCAGDFGTAPVGVTNSMTYKKVPGLPTDMVAIAGADRHACGVTSSGEVKCWGEDFGSALGSLSGLTTKLAKKATLSVVAPPIGTWTIKGTYQGDATYASSFGTAPLTIDKAPTTATIASSANPSTWGDDFTLTATVAGINGTLPTGNVAFHRNGDFIKGGIALDAAGKSTITSTQPIGTFGWTVTYVGSANHVGVTSSAFNQVMNPAATTTTLVSSANPSTFGQGVKFSATVASAAGTPGGTVEFFDGTTSLGTDTMSAGLAELTVTGLSVGSHTIKAVHAASGNYAASTSTTLTQVVEPAPTTTTMTVADGSLVFGQPANLTITVASPAGTPTGAIEILEGATSRGTGTLAGGTATVKIPALALGSHSLTARYAGAAGFPASTSAAKVVNVVKAGTTATLTTSAAQYNPGTAIDFTAKVTSKAPSVAVPTGTVTFHGGAKVLGTAMLDATGTAKISSAALPFGATNVWASYAGSTNFGAVESAKKAIAIDYRAGPETRVNTTTAGPQGNPAVAYGISGGALAVWESATAVGANNAIVGRLISAAGVPTGAEFVIAPAAVGVYAPRATGLYGGDFVVVWYAGQGADPDIWMRRYAPTGKPRAAAVRVNTVTTGIQTMPTVVGLAAGGYVVAWQDEGAARGVYFRRYDAAGTAVGAQTKIATTTSQTQGWPSVIPLTTGGFVLGWGGHSSTTGFSLYGQRYDANAVKVGTEFRITTTAKPEAMNFALQPLTGGTFMAVWDEVDAGGVRTDVFRQRFTAGAAPSGTVLRINTSTTGAHGAPAAALVAGGRTVITWTAPDADGEGVSGQMFSATGARVETPWAVNTTTAKAQSGPVMTGLGSGADLAKTWITLWTSKDQDGSDDGVYLQRFKAP